MEDKLFTNAHILSWLRYFSDNTDIDLEHVKILDITRKNKNLIPTVESHKTVLVFTEADIPRSFTRCGTPVWESASAGITLDRIPRALSFISP